MHLVLHCEELKTPELLSSSVILTMASLKFILQAICIAEMCTETQHAFTFNNTNLNDANAQCNPVNRLQHTLQPSY